MNRDADMDLWLERVAVSDRRYTEQLNELAGIGDVDALDTPFDELSEQERLALIAGIDAKLTSLDAPKQAPTHPSRRSAPRAARIAPQWSVAAAVLSLAAGMVFVFSDRLTPRLETSLPDYVLHPPREDSTYRGTDPHVAVPGSLPPSYTLGRPLAFILQPSRRSDLEPQVWAFDARNPDQPLPGLEVTWSDGGGVWVKLRTAAGDVNLQPGATELVFILGQGGATTPSLAVVSGEETPPTAMRRLTFPLRWVTATESQPPEDPAPRQ